MRPYTIPLLLFMGQTVALVGISALSSSSSSSDGATTAQKVRCRTRVTYDGSQFVGFQLQGHDDNKKEQRSVQGVLEEVLFQRFQRPIRVVGAGRTDAGVHSRGQAIHFDLYENETIALDDETTPLQTSMNHMLPPDVRVWNVQKAPPRQEETVNGRTSVHEWNVMRKCNSKLYSYRLCIGSYMDPTDRHGRWQLDWGHEVDPTVLTKILSKCEGTHDFKCFAGALEQNERKTGKRMGTIRTIHKIELIPEEHQPDHYRIDIYLEGALYKMVRNIVGTSLDVCRGKLSETEFDKLLSPPEDFSRRNNPCKPAPPQGLCLEHVFYPDDDF